MPFDDNRDADYRRDPERPKRREQSAERDAPAVRLVGPEREAFVEGQSGQGTSHFMSTT